MRKPNWFIGYRVDPGDWFEELTASTPEGLRRFHPEDLHLTVAFLGQVEEPATRGAWKLAREADFPAVTVDFVGIEPFGRPSSPSAFSLTLERGRDELIEAIRTHRNDLIGAVDKPPETRPPRPHITVARPGRGADRELVEQGMAWCEQVTPPDVELELDELALYTWADERKQRLFKVVDSMRLG